MGSEASQARSRYRPLPPCPWSVRPSTSASVSSDECTKSSKSVPSMGSHFIVTQTASEKKDFVRAGFADFPNSVYTRTMAGAAWFAPAGQKAAIAPCAGAATVVAEFSPCRVSRPQRAAAPPGEMDICDTSSTRSRRRSCKVFPSNTCISPDTQRKAWCSSVLQAMGGHRTGEYVGTKRRPLGIKDAHAHPGPRRTRRHSCVAR
mmetsp:Transcript_39485/g.108783  ORF Transcript_39485/g.108783 Transcript_39485/m.108783 type:complete len:204 (+) Transcript_39485:1583-2194(+)